jgi:hypothetical protein
LSHVALTRRGRHGCLGSDNGTSWSIVVSDAPELLRSLREVKGEAA